MQKFLTHFGKKLANPAWLFWLLPWYGVVLIAGTVAQKYVGLYQAQKAIFNAVIWWAGPIPLLGGQGVLVALAIGLITKLLLRSPWHWARLGINLIHIGAIALLLAGALTAANQEEGYIEIQTGQQSDIVEDYHQRELVIHTNDDREWHYDFNQLKIGEVITEQNMPYKFVVESKCRNCAILNDKDNTLIEGQPALQQETSNYGLMLQVVNPVDGTSYVLPIYENLDHFPAVHFGQDNKNSDSYLYPTVQKTARILPFALKLEKFDEQLYPGSEIAREYQSNLQIIDKGVAWPARVAMNEPLHHGGYTFFQSSFERLPNGQVSTVLSVVHNQARWGLYLATALIIGGLIIYLGQRYAKAL